MRYTQTIVLNGLKEAIRETRLYRKELGRLSKIGKVKIKVEIDTPKSMATSPIIVDEGFLNEALKPAMRLDPSMLASYIANGDILPDKKRSFISGIQRAIEARKNKQGRRVITNRDDYIKQYAGDFIVMRGKIGKGASNLANKGIRSALTRGNK